MNVLFQPILKPLLISMKVAGGILPESSPVMVRAHEATDDIVHVYEDEKISSRFSSIQEKQEWMKMTFVMHGKEAGFSADPKGSNDQGNACGALQVWKLYLPEGLTCTKVRSSRKLGLRAGVLVALDFRDKCGKSLGEAWSGFAMGHCGPKGMAINVILERCKLAGVSCR